jgi:hypothetical protein
VGSKWVGGEEKGWEGKGGGGGKGEEMTQTLYAHMNKRKNFQKRKEYREK